MNNENDVTEFCPEEVYIQRRAYTGKEGLEVELTVWETPGAEAVKYVRADLVRGEQLWGHVEGLLTELDFPWQDYTEVTAFEAITHIEEAINNLQQEIGRLENKIK